MWETWVQSLVWKDPLEKGKATHSRISWTVHGVAKNRTGLSDFHFHFTSMGDECDCPMAWTLVLRFLGTGMRIDLFQSCGHCWVFQICWHMECSTLIISSFRVFNSSIGITSHQLALLTAVLPKTNLTSHSRMFGSGWLTTCPYLNSSSKSLLCSSSMCILLIPSWSLQRLLSLYHFYPLMCPFWVKCSLDISICCYT